MAQAVQYQPKYLRNDDKAFKAVTLRTDNDGWIEFKADAKLNPNNFFKDYANSLGLDKDYNFKAIKEDIDKQQKHQYYQLYYKNIEVEGVMFSLHSDNGILTLGHGKIPDGLNQDVSKPMPEPKALDLALANMKVTLQEISNAGRKKPEGVLLLARLSEQPTSSAFKLCYAFDIFGNDTFNAFRVYIDATTGEVLQKISLIHNCLRHNSQVEAGISEPAETNTLTTAKAPLLASSFIPNYARYLNGQASLIFDTDPNPTVAGQHWLHSFNNALVTRRFVNNVISEVTNIGSNWQANLARNAQTAHWLTQRMFQFMTQKPIERSGLNGNGSYPIIRTDLPDRRSGYLKSENLAYFGTLNNNSMVTADLVGHEYMHGVTRWATPGGNGLEYAGESGAIDESIADIFGTAFERNLLPNNWNWNISEDCGFALRNMANPLLSLDFAQPSQYGGTNWAPTNGSKDPDNGGVHTNSGVMNRWFNMLCTGFNNNSTVRVTAIDFNRALAIVYGALTTYLQRYSTYADMRNATIYAARDLYGNCSMEVRQVQNAWYHVNNNVWSFCAVDCNYNVTASVANSNPACNTTMTLTANCSGSGCYDIDYAWSNNSGNIGTGPSFTTNAPSSAGSQTYTVSVSKSGCNFTTSSVPVNVSCGGGSTACVVNKVRLKFRTDCCFDRLVGATIQGSNNGSAWNTLYTFNQNATGNWQDFTFSNSASYNQIRFVASQSGFGELFEIEFYNGNTKLNGTPFGNGAQDYGLTWQNALDGNLNTFWHGSVYTPGATNYVGLILSGCGAAPTCNYTAGQVFYTWSVTGEQIAAQYCNGVLYARATWGAFKSRTWLIAAGYNASLAQCFAESVPCARTGDKEEVNPYNIEVYPNPTKDITSVSYRLPKNEVASLQLIDLVGKVLTTKEIKGTGNTEITVYDLSTFADGVYLFELKNDKFFNRRKIVVIK